MPKPKNKKTAFIDKKNAVSFHLVHRSQQDPLAADDEAPQHVLQPILKNDLDMVKEEEREFGVFYDDNYNYIQHLKDRDIVDHDWSDADRFILESEGRKLEKSKIKDGEIKVQGTSMALPSTVFATVGKEEEVGLLNKAAPTGLDLSLDPDIVAAMDDDFNFDDPNNELDDDFMMQAMDEGGSGDDSDYDDENSDVGSDFGGGRSEDEKDDEVPSLQSWDGEETGTKFTNYSMSSSCIRRNNQLSLLDDKFDKFMDQYGELEEGALEGEEIEGAVEEEGDRMKQLLMESEKERTTRRQQLDREREVSLKMLETGEDDEEMEKIVVNGEKWDCESILSTYSTLYNHPKIISERRPDHIKLSSKTGIPKDTLGRGLTAAALKQLDLDTGVGIEDDMQSIGSRVSAISVRPKHETFEEKKARKAAVKNFRKERREEKKANTQAFKSEESRQAKISMNVQNNLQGIKIC